MNIGIRYNTKEEVPSNWAHLYHQDGENWELMSAGQFKTSDDVFRVQESLRKERVDHKGTKGKLAKFSGLDADEVLNKLDRYDEMEQAAGGKLDDEKINGMVETRIKSRVAPLERQITQLTTEKEELLGSVTEFQGRERRRSIHDHIRQAATGSKMRDTAIDDALLLGENVFDIDEAGNVVTRDNVGVTPGIDPNVWLAEMKTKRSHWWPDSQGAGARGGAGGTGGDNPFTSDNWNLTQQGQLIRQNRVQAEQMAKSAGTRIGGPRPIKK